MCSHSDSHCVSGGAISAKNSPTHPSHGFAWAPRLRSPSPIMTPDKMRIFSPFFHRKASRNATKSSKMSYYIVFYNSSRKYFQFPRFPDKFEFLAKSKMAVILAAILDGVKGPSIAITHNIYLIL